MLPFASAQAPEQKYTQEHNFTRDLYLARNPVKMVEPGKRDSGKTRIAEQHLKDFQIKNS